MSSVTLALRPLEFFFAQYRRIWRGTAVTSVVTPVVYLLALGVGLGVFVDRSTDLAKGVSYLEFVAPGLLADLPIATLGAVVIAAALKLVDVGSFVRLWRTRRSEFLLGLASFVGVAFVGVIQGIFLAVGLSLLAFVRRAWSPHDAVLGRADGVKGYHDLDYYPRAKQIPGPSWSFKQAGRNASDCTWTVNCRDDPVSITSKL